jgi:hypothetical protein
LGPGEAGRGRERSGTERTERERRGGREGREREGERRKRRRRRRRRRRREDINVVHNRSQRKTLWNRFSPSPIKRGTVF